MNENSTEDDGFTSLDSLEYTPQEQAIVIGADQSIQNKKIGKRLDESEVIIVSPIEDEQQLSLQDTSHVSVVTVGDEREQVKDSSQLAIITNDEDHSKKMMNGQVGKLVIQRFFFLKIDLINFESLVTTVNRSTHAIANKINSFA